MRGYNFSLFQEVIDKLCANEVLEEKYKDLAINEAYKDFREFHIQPDLLLIYAINNDTLILVAAITGTHTDLINIQNNKVTHMIT